MVMTLVLAIAAGRIATLACLVVMRKDSRIRLASILADEHLFAEGACRLGWLLDSCLPPPAAAGTGGVGGTDETLVLVAAVETRFCGLVLFFIGLLRAAVPWHGLVSTSLLTYPHGLFITLCTE